jgi:hypothetical protein
MGFFDPATARDAVRMSMLANTITIFRFIQISLVFDCLPVSTEQPGKRIDLIEGTGTEQQEHFCGEHRSQFKYEMDPAENWLYSPAPTMTA